MRIFTLVLLVLFFSGPAQISGQNPFDIKGRKSAPETPVLIAKPDSLTSTPVQAPVQVNPTQTPEVEILDLSGDNPFEVSHIPLRTSEFRSKTMTKEALQESKNSFFQRNVPLFLILLSLALLALIKVGFRDNAISKSFRATYNTNYMKLIKADSLYGMSRSYLILYAVFFINAAVAINHFVYKGQSSFSKLIWIAFVIILVYLGKHMGLWILGKVFREIGKITSNYSFSTHISNIVLGIILLPLNLLMIYGYPGGMKFFMYLILIIALIIYLNRLIRGVLMGSTYLATNQFHFFLYLCTCEIGPLLILIKVLRSII